MSDLFDKRDILTVATADQAVIGDEGYFGSGLCTIAYNVDRKNVHRLCDVSADETSCFIDDDGLDYLFFLPADKVKKKEPSCRPLKNIDELFNFLMPDMNQKIDRYQKAELLLGEKITLKKKENNFVKVITINEVGFYGNDENNDTYLNFSLVSELFHYYEILIDGEWVPFGIER